MADGSIGSGDNYAERLSKLLPAEATAAFVAVNGAVSSVPSAGGQELTALVFVGIIMVCTWFLLSRVKRISSQLQIWLTVLAVPLWAASIRPEMVTEWFPDRDVRSYLQAAIVGSMALATIFFPVLFREPRQVIPEEAVSAKTDTRATNV